MQRRRNDFPCLGSIRFRQGAPWGLKDKGGRGSVRLLLSRHGDFRQDVVDDVVRGNVFRFSLIREQDAVAQDIVGQVLDVLWSDEGTMV